MKTDVQLPHSELQQIIDNILACGKINRADQQRFMSILLSQSSIGKEEQSQLNRVFDLLRVGKLRVVD
jgi:polyhydroxyalkanoate synthesis regulator phasin